MLEDLTGDSIYSQVIMEEPPPRAVLLVEGPDDEAILFDHLADGVVGIIAGNKKAVLGAAQIALDTSVGIVFGLIDRDLDGVRGRDSYPENVVATDSYDLVADLIEVFGEESLRRVMNAHAARGVRTVETATGRSVAEVVFDIAGPLAAVRLASLRFNYPLVLENYEFKHVITASLGAADVSVYVNNALCRQAGFTVNATVIESVRDVLPEVRDRRHAGGHDLVAATVALMASVGCQISKKAVAGNLISFATKETLGIVACIQRLNSLGRAVASTDLIDCHAA